jgi:hypothetical protein
MAAQKQSCDWWVEGFDPVQAALLLRCRTTGKTAVIPDPTPLEILMASVINFSPYAWVEHARVEECVIPEASYEMAAEARRNSVCYRTQGLMRRCVE